MEMKKNFCCIKCSKYGNFKNPTTSYILDKRFSILLVISVTVKVKKYLKKKNQLRY